MSDLLTQLQTIANRIDEHGETISTEEAAKTSVVLPLLQALGYDVFDPSEVIPEFTADTVGKKGEKVDYAIRLGGEIRILVECKSLTTRLEKNHLSQLYRYFSVTDAKFAILTNGRRFEFYTDLEAPNRLDARPFFIFDLLDHSAASVGELEKFAKPAFDIERILATAERLKYVSATKQFLRKEMEDPCDDLVKIVCSAVYDGRLTGSVRDLLSAAIRTAYKEIMRDEVRSRLSTALRSSADVDLDPDDKEVSEIETTQEEIEGTMTIKAIVRGTLDSKRVGLRDSKSYCAVLVDDNNRKPLARLHFNRSQKYVGLFDGSKEDRVPIDDLDQIYGLSDRLIATAARYVETPEAP